MKEFLLFILLFCFSSLNAQLLAETDKQKHYAAGAIVGSIVYGITLGETEDKTLAFAASILGSVAAGYIKETFDAKQGYGFDNRDLLATTYGGLTVGITLDIFARDGKKNKSIINLFKKKKRNKKLNHNLTLSDLHY
jgi:hypothetical protein